MAIYDYAVIGGGIIGLSTAVQLNRRFPDARVVLLEKEESPAEHQTGRNSGVIHSGIYYKPGSYKARFAKAGAASMVQFCEQHGIPYDVCGKVIVAIKASEIPLLDNLFQRGRQNGVPVEKISSSQVREIEPHVSCVAGLRVASTGITSYRKVCLEYLRQIYAHGATVNFRCEVKRIRENRTAHLVETSSGEYEAKFVINCAGLHSDRVALASGTDPKMKIIPFRGEYYELVPERRHLVKTLIYPVPNPDFPFLGVHFTRMIDGSIHAGPNAVLAFAREGYAKTDFNWRDFMDTMTYGGFWRLARKHMGDGLMEMYRSISKAAFTRSLQQMIPEVRAADLVVCDSGIRAQALTRDGSLVDDFMFAAGRNTLHVCNAPSPAATASIEIGKEIVRQLPAVVGERAAVLI